MIIFQGFFFVPLRNFAYCDELPKARGLLLAGAAVIFSLCSLAIQTQAAAFSTISQAEEIRIADLIFKNECNRKFECLVTWNDGEEFPSLGIGHFIWFPKGSDAPFQESFPDLLRWYQDRSIAIPDKFQHILKPNQPCPWQTKQDFLKPENQEDIQALRKFLADTKAVQASFIMQRLSDALPKMLEVGQSESEKKKIEQQFKRVAASPNGWYVLVDYVNFKGEGIKPSERYQGKGWGLVQVLLNMNSQGNALQALATSAKQVLLQRVENAPPERNEVRWLKGWFKRLETY